MAIENPRKAAIRVAAAELWAASGYHGTGIEELSQSVGLRRGALYHHIGSKEGLLYEVSRAAIVRLLDATHDDPTASAEDRLRALSRQLMVDIAAHLAEWTVFFREVPWLTGEWRAEVFELRDRYEAIWQSVLDDGVATGEFRPLGSLAVKGILGMHNYAYLWLRPHGRLRPEEVADQFLEVLLGGVRRPGTRRPAHPSPKRR